MQVDELYELSSDLLSTNRQVRLRVGGESMFPFLRNGDEILVERCSYEHLAVGDIVVFRTEKKWIAHRLHKIITVNDKIFLSTKGDSCKKTDPVIPEEFYIGKVVALYRKGKERKIRINRKNVNVKFSRISTHLIILMLWHKNFYNKIVGTSRKINQRLWFICRNSRRWMSINIIVSMLQGILPFVIIYLFKLMVDGILKMHDHASGGIFVNSQVIIIVVTGVVFLFSAILNILGAEFRERLSQSVTTYIFDLLHRKHSVLGMAYLEHAGQQDKIHRAVQEAGHRPLKMINGSLSAMQSVISWIVIAAILLKIHWIIFILILTAVIPGFIVRFIFAKRMYRMNKSNSQKERESYYYNRILTSLSFAKEVRLFGTGNFFSERFQKLQKNLHSQKNALLRKRALADIFAQVFAVALTFFSFGIIAFLAAKGEISIGTVILFIFIFQRGYTILKDFFQSVAGLYEDNVFLNDFFDFLDLPVPCGVKNETEKFSSLQKGITIEDLSFQYPSSCRKALDSLSLEIPAGKTVALVGPNGSGKTTLVKLLCGFYTVDKGKILFDGRDITSVNTDELRKQITAVFQDFALYNLTAAENIFLGDLAQSPSSEKIRQAAKDAGIDDVLEKLPSGYTNVIGNLFEKGEELSIGQWQKMAIARAFYRNAPVLFMDEPSSALDAETELQLLQNLKSLAKDKTVLIISHRLSTIRWADMIYVMEEGKIVEIGDHEQLIRLQGKYFRMYESSRGI